MSLLLICPFMAAAGAENINFVHIGLEDGLSQSTVVSIVQDRKGNMWFATRDGLNRYDGYVFTVYRHDDRDSLSIANDVIHTVRMDGKGRIWAGTYSGLSLYDPELDNFRNWSFSDEGRAAEVEGIAPMPDGTLLLATSAGLKSFDPVSGTFSGNGAFAGTSGDKVTSILVNGDDVFIGTFSGRLRRYSVKGDLLKEFGSGAFSGACINAMYVTPDRTLWVGTEGAGLFSLGLHGNGESVRYCRDSGELTSDYVRSLATDQNGNLWVGTFQSLNVRDAKSGRFSVYDSDPVRKGSLSQSSVRSIFRDVQGGMWIGTYFGGINYYHPLMQRFTALRNIPYRNSLNDNVVSCIVEDDEGLLWIGTNSGGVNRYDPRTGRFAHFTSDDGLGADDIKAIYVDGDKVYVGQHHGGLGIISRNSGKIINIGGSDGSLPGGNVYSIIPYDDKSLLLGMVNGTVLRYFKADGRVIRMEMPIPGGYSVYGRLIMMTRDSEGRIWIGQNPGLSVWKPVAKGETSGNELERVELFPQGSGMDRTSVNCVTEVSSGHFWIGTGEGLYSFDEKSGKMRRYTVKDGLPGNVIYGVLEDRQGNLWISTGSGLSCHDPEAGTFRNYTSSDGLSGNQFCLYSYCRAKSGKMYFGSIGGITVFDPESLPENPYIPSVSLTGLWVSNALVRPGDGTGILSADIGETRSVSLSQSQSSFSISFSVADYISRKHNAFAYRLDGYEKEWRRVNDEGRTAAYSNLKPGKYTFMVKAANKDGVWNDDPTCLGITILPFWYNTLWARLLMAAVLLSAGFLVLRYILVRKKMEMQLELEKVDKERIREVNEMKLRFFVNISHELRTPLTMIIAPLQEVLAKVQDRWTLQRLRYVEKNAGRLLYLVNQLMDYRRAELGVFRLKVRQTDVHSLLRKVYDFYVQLAEEEGIEYRFSSEMEGREVPCDPNYLGMILNNLLSNAFKYTPPGKWISLSARMDGEMLLVQVSDAGKGISPEKQKLVFERFYQVDQDHIGSGIGLSLVKNLAEMHHGRVDLESSPGEGSTFSVRIPADPAAYSPEETAGPGGEDAEEQVYSTNSSEMHVMNAASGEEGISDGGVPDGPSTPVQQVADTGSRSRIMIVEDNPEILGYLSDGLSAEYEVMAACNGSEALDMMKDESPDLILTDVMMPVMDGIKFCRTVKQNLQTCHIPVIMLSAKSDVKWQLEGLQVGADDYIPKPFSLAVVMSKVRNMLRTRRGIIEHYAGSVTVEPEKMMLSKLDEQFMNRAVSIVGKHLDDASFSADEFAGEMNMSRSNLHIKMKALTGASTTEFIRKIRFAKACELLKEGLHSVADISVMCGFSSPAYFATSFKKYMGCLPSEYSRLPSSPAAD